MREIFAYKNVVCAERVLIDVVILLHIKIYLAKCTQGLYLIAYLVLYQKFLT